MPFLLFLRDHLRSGSSVVQFGDHFRSGDHLGSGIICSAVEPINEHIKAVPDIVKVQMTRKISHFKNTLI